MHCELQTSAISQYAQSNSPKCGLFTTTRSQNVRTQQRSIIVRMGKRTENAQWHQSDKAVHPIQ